MYNESGSCWFETYQNSSTRRKLIKVKCNMLKFRLYCPINASVTDLILWMILFDQITQVCAIPMQLWQSLSK